MSGPTFTLPDLIKMVPAYAELFGESTRCECPECESMLSPAAYFVDLLQFLGRSGKNAAGKTPLDVLLGRRPDLAHILLTCENSQTPLPAIDLVNEVLESYVALGKLDATTAHDTGPATAEELAAHPQYTLESAYAILAAALYPIALPFNLPLETARAYLRIIGTSRLEILRTLRQDSLTLLDFATEQAVAAESLGFSQLDFELITGMQYGGASAASGTLEDLFGLTAADLTPLLQAGSAGNIVRLVQHRLIAAAIAPLPPLNGVFDPATENALKAFQAANAIPVTGTTTPLTWTFLTTVTPDSHSGLLLSWVTEFLQRTDRPYLDLIALCESRSFNPLGAAIRALGATAVTWNDVEALAAGGFASPNPNIVSGAAKLGLSTTVFVAWLKNNFDALAAGIVIESMNNSCDLAEARLRQVNGAPVPDETLVAMNRFARMARKTGLSIRDLDRALRTLQQLGVGGLTDANLTLSLAALLRVQTRLGLSFSNLTVLFGYLERGPGSVYTQLFLNRATLQLDPSFGLLFDETELAQTTELMDDHAPALMAAFRLTEEELNLVRADAALASPTVPLSVGNLANVYRYPLLAGALGVDISDLISLRALSAGNPWLGSTDQPIRLERWLDDFTLTAKSELPIAELDYLLRHVVRPSFAAPTPEEWTAWISTLHQGQIGLQAEIGDVSEINAERFRTILTRLLDADSVDLFLGVVTGSATFSAVYPTVPTPAVIASLAPNITFHPEEKLIRFHRLEMPAGSAVTLGALTDPESTALQTLAGADFQLVDAIKILQLRPRRLLDNALAGIPTGAALKAEILKHGPGARTVEEKLKLLIETMLPFIRESLAQGFIRQQLLALASLDAPLLALLLEDAAILTAPGSAAPVLTALRALEQSGWSAEFFAATNLTGPVFGAATVQEIAFDDAALDFGQPSPVGSGRWSALWLPEAINPIVFEIRTTGTPSIFWKGAAIPSTQLGTVWTFDPIQPEPGVPTTIALEWRRLTPGPTALTFSWTSGTDARVALPSRLLIPAAIATTASRALVLLDKAARLTRALRLDADLLKQFASSTGPAAGFSFKSLPVERDSTSSPAIDSAAPALFTGLRRLIQLAQLAPRFRGPGGVPGVLRSASLAEAEAAIVAAAGWPSSDVALLLGPSGFNVTLADLTNGRAILHLERAMAVARRVGLSVAKLQLWAIQPVSATQAEDVKRTVRAKFTEVEWLSLAPALHDPLREAKRDALTGYLLPRLRLRTRDQLFEFFLIDVQVSPIVKTSRFQSAIFACQTFVQRIQLNLENRGILSPVSVVPGAIDSVIWEAKRNYRVQTAAREVWLWPETFMREPWRDDKTPIFKTFEGKLAQSDLTPESIEEAVQEYVENLDVVARLEICGTYVQTFDWGSEKRIDVVHMVGRSTLGSPSTFHYRRLEDDCDWSPWERLPIDVDAVHNGKIEGVHVLPVIWNRRLYICWPMFEEKPDPAPPTRNPLTETSEHRAWKKDHGQWEREVAQWNIDNEKWKSNPAAYKAQVNAAGIVFLIFQPLPPPRSEPAEPEDRESLVPQKTHLEIRLAWCNFFNGRWSAKEVSSVILKASNLNAASYVFSAVPLPNGAVSIEFICRQFTRTWVKNSGSGGGLMAIDIVSQDRIERGSFELSGTHGRITVTGHVLGLAPGEIAPLWIVEPEHTQPIFNTFELKPGTVGLTFNEGDYLPLNVRLLGGKLMQQRRKPLEVLKKSPSLYRVTPPHHFPQYVVQGPSFYQDFDRTYLMTPARGVYLPPHIWAEPDPAFVAKLQKGKNFVIKVPQLQGSELPPPQEKPRWQTFHDTARALARVETSHHLLPVLLDEAFSSSANLISDEFAWDYFEQKTLLGSLYTKVETRILFRNLFHPFSTEFIRRLNLGGLDALFTIETQSLNRDAGANRFQGTYQPTTRVAKPYPEEKVDFGLTSYGVYNRELFLHVPKLLAHTLEGAGLMPEGERFLRCLLDPTGGISPSSPTGNTDELWRYLPFRGSKAARIQELLTNLSYVGPDPAKLAFKQQAVEQITAWEKDPFNPFLLGRLRIGAMQKYVFLAWVEHLVLRADLLLRSDRPEPINEAVQLLVFASHLLGARPEQVPPRTRRQPKSYQTLKADLDRFSNALVELENEFPFTAPTPPPGSPPGGGGLLGLSESLYFCVPPNARLQQLWDTVADRLFKIRHGMNLEGIVRELPLFEPRIDPLLLVEARARGVDLATVLAGLNAPLPQHRCEVYLEMSLRATEDLRRSCQDLLSALEKRDNEQFNLRRAEQDVTLLREQIRRVKALEIDSAKIQIKSLEEAEKLITSVRIPHFMALLGLADLPPAGALAEAKVLMSQAELTRINQLNEARKDLANAGKFQQSSKMMSAIPSMMIGSAGISSPVLETYLGGHMLSLGLDAFAKMHEQSAADSTHAAAIAGIRADFERRAEGWAESLSEALQERERIGKELIGSRIRLQLSQFQLESHDKDTQFAQERFDFLRTKRTGTQCYDWLIEQNNILVAEFYKVAFDLAQRAQQAYRFDTGDLTAKFVEFNYFDKAHFGLLAGERLALSLRKMDRARLDQEQFDFEISKPVSLALHDPFALVTLKATGQCEFTLPESLFDADHPGHYLRRLRHVSVTIPCVTGPYVTVNATLTLLNSRTRMTSLVPATGYPERENDPRFQHHRGVVRSIATSHANEDTGLSNSTRTSGRKGPFEGFGAISRWRLSVPKDTNAFELNVMTDVLLRCELTSRPGGDILEKAARAAFILPEQKGLARLLNLNHEQTAAWQRFLHPLDQTAPDQSLEFDLDLARFAYRSQSRAISLTSLTFLLQIDDFAAYQGATALSAEVIVTPLKNTAAPGLPPEYVPAGASKVTAIVFQSLPTRLGGTPVARVEFFGPLPQRVTLRAKSIDVALLAPRYIDETGTGPTKRFRLTDRTLRGLSLLVAYDAAAL